MSVCNLIAARNTPAPSGGSEPASQESVKQSARRPSAATGSARLSTGLAAHVQCTLHSVAMISQTSSETESRSRWVSLRPLHVSLALLALVRSAGGSLLQ